MTHTTLFSRFTRMVSKWLGHPLAFGFALLIVITWAALGPLFHLSDTWQLVINTGTTIVTFLMVFLIQNTQNRDSEAVQIKLDELIRAMKGADNSMLNIENLAEEDLRHLQDHYTHLAELTAKRLHDEEEKGAKRTANRERVP